VIESSLAVEAVPCNLCKADDFDVIYPVVDRIITPGTQVVRCRQCDLVYLNPRLRRLEDSFTLEEAYLRDFYIPQSHRSGLLDEKGDLRRAENHGFHSALLYGMEPYRRTNRVLDIGCAIGLFIAAAADAGWESHGIEPSPPLRNYGQARFGANIHAGILADVDLAPESFDVVTLWAVTEHLLDPLGTLRQAYRFLRPGGLLVVSVPNWDSVARKHLGTQWEMFVTDHFYYYTCATITRMVETAGYRPLQITASLLCDAEIDEISAKVDRAAAERAMAEAVAAVPAQRGSTIDLHATRPVTSGDRVRRVQKLVRKGAWQTLGREGVDYVRWQFRPR